MKINKKSKIFIAGHNGMVGSSLCRKFNENGFKNILTVEKKKVNLLDQKAVFKFLKKNKPDLVIIAAARAGGIYANSNYKAKFIYENLQIQNNIIHGSYLAGIRKLFFLGSSCTYPKYSKQPIKEDYLLTSSLEPTNDAYALAKISGLMMCKYYSENYKVEFKSLMPCNLYGPGDNYHYISAFYVYILSHIALIDIDCILRSVLHSRHNRPHRIQYQMSVVLLFFGTIQEVL